MSSRSTIKVQNLCAFKKSFDTWGKTNERQRGLQKPTSNHVLREPAVKPKTLRLGPHAFLLEIELLHRLPSYSRRYYSWTISKCFDATHHGNA